MSFTNKLETTYLNILRYVILAVATLSLIAVLIAGAMALSAALASPPKAPEQIKFEDRVNDLKKGFTIENFKKDNPPKTGEKPQEQSQETTTTPVEKPQEDSFRGFIKSSVAKIADNFITYEKVVHNRDLLKERVENFLEAFPFNNGLRNKTVITFYYETFIPLSGELAKQAPEIAKLSEDKKINIDILLNWHLKQVNAAIETVNEANAKLNTEFKEKQIAYFAKKTSIYKYASIAGSAFGIFLFIIMLFIMVKIERNLRPLQQIADNGKDLLTQN